MRKSQTNENKNFAFSLRVIRVTKCKMNAYMCVYRGTKNNKKYNNGVWNNGRREK